MLTCCEMTLICCESTLIAWLCCEIFAEVTSADAAPPAAVLAHFHAKSPAADFISTVDAAPPRSVLNRFEKLLIAVECAERVMENAERSTVITEASRAETMEAAFEAAFATESAFEAAVETMEAALLAAFAIEIALATWTERMLIFVVRTDASR